jgi:hypothetical protein
MIAIQYSKHQGFDPTTSREYMGRVGREKAVNNRGDLQTP